KPLLRLQQWHLYVEPVRANFRVARSLRRSRRDHSFLRNGHTAIACFSSAPTLLRYGLAEPARCAPKRCHVEHASASEAQSQPDAAYRIAFDPPTLHAVRMSVRVIGDEPLLHARLALRAITWPFGIARSLCSSVQS